MAKIVSPTIAHAIQQYKPNKKGTGWVKYKLGKFHLVKFGTMRATCTRIDFGLADPASVVSKPISELKPSQLCAKCFAAFEVVEEIEVVPFEIDNYPTPEEESEFVARNMGDWDDEDEARSQAELAEEPVDKIVMDEDIDTPTALYDVIMIISNEMDEEPERLLIGETDLLLMKAYKNHRAHAGVIKGANFVECKQCHFHVHSSRYGLVKHWRNEYERGFITNFDDERLK